MITRIKTAIIGIALFIPVMFFSHTYLFNAVIALLCFFSAYELINCFGMKNNIYVSIALYAYSLALPLYTSVSYKYIYNLSILLIFSMMIIAVFSHGKCSIDQLASLGAFGVYLVSSMSGLILLRRADCGEYIIYLVFIGAWATDTAAYFTGKFFGRHKLIEDVSPKKTTEGSIGGIVVCTAVFVLYGILVEIFSDVDANLLYLALAGFVSSIVSQIGDLIMSKLKRTYNIKDFGKILPGHGGILDRFDSILAVVPFLLTLTSRQDIIYIFR